MDKDSHDVMIKGIIHQEIGLFQTPYENVAL